jgi:hypothetical protein
MVQNASPHCISSTYLYKIVKPNVLNAVGKSLKYWKIVGDNPDIDLKGTKSYKTHKTTNSSPSATYPLHHAGADLPLQHELRCQFKINNPIFIS